MRWITLILFFFSASYLWAQNTNDNLFRQLDSDLPTPNVYRNAAGAPGHKYYQQQVDYQIKVELDESTNVLRGEETIIYKNHSPDALSYLWVQLDQNVRARDAESKSTQHGPFRTSHSEDQLDKILNPFDGGFKIQDVQLEGEKAHYAIVKTMMRVDLDKVLLPGESRRIMIKWWYNINDRAKEGGRSGMEFFHEEDNYIYTIAQFFPRMCKYNDVYGWQNKQFLGRGEFTLEFGDYEVSITVPADHVVGATGTLQNTDHLTRSQRKRLEKANNEFDQPIYIVSPEEAKENQKSKSTDKKTWIFKAENVRDFAFASSRKFVWDAMSVQQSSKNVLAMSLYPIEGMPLWNRYSTKAVAHTLKWYSHYTFDYPYPVAYSVHTKRIGMEYPMICFNYGRPDTTGEYSKRLKYGMISVIIHEVGHNYFPMIVNSDERQWTWMDEGLNTFLQYLSEQQWEEHYPSRRGPAYKIVDYMKGDKSKISPIMTNSESIFQFGNNAYGKPATALNILRETILGRELFDFAFKTYAERWKFKHPTPADFFRTMEDASGIDLDWFWRSWFYTTDHVDLQLSDFHPISFDTSQSSLKTSDPKWNDYITNIRNKEESIITYDKMDTTLIDEHSAFIEETSPDLMNGYKGNYFYQFEVTRIGGIPMPIIIGIYFTDGSFERRYYPAEIWRFNEKSITKVFHAKKRVLEMVLDPLLETADINTFNNYFPNKPEKSRYELFLENK